MLKAGDVETNPGPIATRRSARLRGIPAEQANVTELLTAVDHEASGFEGFGADPDGSLRTGAGSDSMMAAVDRFWRKVPRRKKWTNKQHKLNKRTSDYLRVTVWNCGGLRKKKEELQYNAKRLKTDIIMLQEVQFSKGKPAPKLNGFNDPVIQRRTRARMSTNATPTGGGVAIYVKRGVAYEQLKDRPFPTADDSTEWCGIKVFAAKPKNNIALHNIYRPPIRNNESDDRVDEFTCDQWPIDKNTILAGDLNAHHQIWDQNCDEPDNIGESIADFCVLRNFTPLNSGMPTRLGQNSEGTAPDVCLSHSELSGRVTWSLGEQASSDHLPMHMNIRMDGHKPVSPLMKRRVYRKANWESFRGYINTKLMEVDKDAPLLKKMATFETVVMEAANKYIPMGPNQTHNHGLRISQISFVS